MPSTRPCAWCFIAWAVSLLVVASLARGVEVSEKEIQSRKCLDCRGQSRIATLTPADRVGMIAPGTQPSTRPTRPEIHVTRESLARSVHASLACVDCHQGAAKLPHAQ